MSMNNGLGDNNESMADCKPTYSMPGILHFIQHEWSKFEMERAQWDIERAELQARIAFLQGERKGQENLKRDLIRRIKMLEFALKQERAKVHKLKFGTEMNVDPQLNDTKDDSKLSDSMSNNANMSWKHGRQLLRQYLQEVGYSDTILDVRSQRVRALLGNNYDVTKPVENDNKVLNGDISAEESKSAGFLLSSHMSGGPSESDVLNDFQFLQGDKEEDAVDSAAGDVERKARANIDDFEDNEEFGDTEMALAEFDFLNPIQDSPDDKDTDWSVDQNKLTAMKEQFRMEKRQTKKKGMKRPVKKDLQSMLDTLRGSDSQQNSNDVDIHIPEDDNLAFTVGRASEEPIENSMGLGALAGLTVANEADPLLFDITKGKELSRKTWNQKFTLRSHFDGVRSIKFLPEESAVITASEDNTLKLWNLNKPNSSKKNQSLDVDPIYSFRGHIGAVLSLEVDNEGVMCYSGGVDSTVRCWSIPNINIDTYPSYDPSVAGETLIGHTDAVWSLSYCASRQQLLSASSDMTVRLWNPTSKDPLIQTLHSDGALPTCVQFVQCDSSHAAVAHADGKVLLYDLETGKVTTSLVDAEGSRVNCVVTHPTMPISITATDDRHIKFYDHNSGKEIRSVVAHLGPVTSLAVDPNGLYLLSGSDDCSIRLWNLDTKTCIQELTSHRRKFDESIYSVAFHPSATYIASAGADSLAKVFV